MIRLFKHCIPFAVLFRSHIDLCLLFALGRRAIASLADYVGKVRASEVVPVLEERRNALLLLLGAR